MSRRNTDPIERKRRKVLKSLRNTPPGFIDLIEYVRIRTHCTAGMAQKVLLSGALRVDSHPLGYRWEGKGGDARKVLDRYVDAKHRPHIRVEWDNV